MHFQAFVFLLVSFVLALPWWAGRSAALVAFDPHTDEARFGEADAAKDETPPRVQSVLPPRALYAHFPVAPDRDAPRLMNPLFKKEVSAQSAFVADTASGAPLYQKNSAEVRPIGSITKLLTALVILADNPDLNKETAIVREDGVQGSSVIQEGDNVSIGDLLHIGLIASSNTAVNALVRAEGYTREQFAEKMNKTARALGMISSHFVEPTGLDKNNTSTAEDIARLLRAVMSREEIKKIIGMQSYRFRVRNARSMRVAYSTDLLLDKRTSNIALRGMRVIGGKTGFIDEAGYCFAAVLEGQHVQRVIVVVLGSRDHWSRFSEAAELAQWAFKNFEWPAATAFGG